MIAIQIKNATDQSRVKQMEINLFDVTEAWRLQVLTQTKFSPSFSKKWSIFLLSMVKYLRISNDLFGGFKSVFNQAFFLNLTSNVIRQILSPKV